MRVIYRKPKRTFKEYIEAHLDESKAQKADIKPDSKADEYNQTFQAEMEHVLEHPPETWNRYPDTLTGWWGVITMEYNELKQDMLKNDLESFKMNVLHLAAALSKTLDRMESEHE